MSYDPAWDSIKGSVPSSGGVTGSYPNLSLTTTGVTTGTYGGPNHIPSLTIDAHGRVTNAQQFSVPPPPDLSPNPAGVYGSGAAVPRVTIDAKGRVLSVTEHAVEVPNLPGAPNGTYGGANKTLTVVIDAKGRVTSVTEHTFSPSGVLPWGAVGTPNAHWYTQISSAIPHSTSSPISTPPAFPGQLLSVRAYWTSGSGYFIQYAMYAGVGTSWQCIAWAPQQYYP